MNEISSADSLEVAAERLDRALKRLETGVDALGARAQSYVEAERERQRLVGERSRLTTELDRAGERAERLDDAAAQVSRRLVDAMETVKSVLAK